LHLKNRAAWAVRAQLFVDWVERPSAHGVTSAQQKLPAQRERSRSYRMNDFVVSDDMVELSSETDDDSIWSSSADDSESEDESDFAAEPEVGMVIKEKWKMSDGSFDWFDGIIVSQCSRYFKIKWRCGGKCTIYHRRSWAEKVETGSLKIID